jgi:plastocyanin
MRDPIRRASRTLATAVLGALLTVVVTIPAAQAQDDMVVITSSLEPTSLEVAPGTTVTWRNDDAERHRIRSREGPERFDSGNLEPGESFMFTFTLAGTYPYVDHRDEENPAYAGTIVVTATPDAAGSPGALASAGTVTIGDRVFIPPTVEIATGGTVEWTNTDGESHTATSPDGAFDSGILAPGTAFSQTFEVAGSYPFFCAIHPDMQGTVTVTDAAPGGSPPASGPPAPSPAASTQPSAAASPAVPSPAVPSQTSVAAATGTAVTILEGAFDPVDLEVAAGASVVWTNISDVGHTVTASDGAFDSGVIGPGDVFTTTFDVPGTVAYACAIHPAMQGTIRVLDAPGPAPPSG